MRRYFDLRRASALYAGTRVEAFVGGVYYTPAVTDALSICDLTFRFPGTPGETPTVGIPALSLAPGEQLLLTGPSGCGKSTLLSLIAGLLTADAGTISIAGENIQALGSAARDRLRGRRIGMVFQTFNLLHGFTAAENVMLALMFSDLQPRAHRERATQLLSTLGLDQAHQTRRVDRLSVGQQQRVAVARALACSPTLVLADEPTASLDPDNAAAAVGLLRSACSSANAALLCVSHDPALPALFPRHVSMQEFGPGAASTVCADGGAR